MRRFVSRVEHVYRRKSFSVANSDDEHSNEEIDDDDDDIERGRGDRRIAGKHSRYAEQFSIPLQRSVRDQCSCRWTSEIIRSWIETYVRVTVLWDELWLGTMAQLQEEISRSVQLMKGRRCRGILSLSFRRVDALKDDLHRLETMTHLSKEEKEYLVKEKQDVLFKSVRLTRSWFTPSFFSSVHHGSGSSSTDHQFLRRNTSGTSLSKGLQ